MAGQLIGYAPAHLLDDDGRVEWWEDDGGQVPTYQTSAEARAALGAAGAERDTWTVVELRLAAESPEQGP